MGSRAEIDRLLASIVGDDPELSSELSKFQKGQKHAKDPVKVFDWHKAAELIIKHKAKDAEAGLSGDWRATGGPILQGGKPVSRTYTYLASVWAIPCIILDDGEEIPCWIYAKDSPGWDSGTCWPKSALDILKRRSKLPPRKESK